MDYTKENRGKPQHLDRMKQIINYDGMRFEHNITPTDIDGFFEINNEIFIFFEVKRDGNNLPLGQGIALKRVIDNLQSAGKCAALFVCTHNVSDPSKQVYAKDLKVKTIYYNQKKYKDEKGRKLKESVDGFISLIKEKQ